LAGGVQTFPWQLLGSGSPPQIGLNSLYAYGTFIVPDETITVDHISAVSGSAVGTVTHAAMGIWAWNDGTTSAALVANCADDATLFASASTVYTRALTSSYQLVAGQPYILGLAVTCSGSETVLGVSGGGIAGLAGLAGLPNTCFYYGNSTPWTSTATFESVFATLNRSGMSGGGVNGGGIAWMAATA
jgi:hypothetical protein